MEGANGQLMHTKINITNSSTGLRNVCTFPAKTRSKVANITTRGERGVTFGRWVKMDKWTEGEPTKPGSSLQFKRVLNIYAFYLAYMVYYLVESVSIKNEDLFQILTFGLYLISLSIAAIGIFGYSNRLQILTRTVWKYFLVWFLAFGTFWRIVTSQSAAVFTYFMEYPLVATFDLVSSYLGILLVIFLYISNSKIWRKM